MATGGDTIGSTCEDDYCGVVNIITVRAELFLRQLNDLEVSVINFVNTYINGFIKDKIYTTAVPEYG